MTCAPAHAAITYLGNGKIPANTTDDTGLLMRLEDGSPGNLAGGMGSAIAYTGVGDRYYMIPDRGPGDGSTGWIDRMYEVHVAITPSGSGFTVTPTLGHAKLFTNESVSYFTGRSSAFNADYPLSSLRLDPEGLRVSHSGRTVFVSDEFGPCVYEFLIRGSRRLRSIGVPPKFLIAHPNSDNTLELPPGNTSGRQANRSMEGLAITPDGSKLYGIMQSPLLQDGALDSLNNRIGTNCRLLEMNLVNGNTREFLYPLSSASIGATEALAMGAASTPAIPPSSRRSSRSTSRAQPISPAWPACRRPGFPWMSHRFRSRSSWTSSRRPGSRAVTSPRSSRGSPSVPTSATAAMCSS
jgi:hypothetical protein